MVQLTLQNRPYTIIDIYRDPGRDFVTKFRENPLTKVSFYSVAGPKSLSKGQEDIFIVCFQRRRKGWKLAKTAYPNKFEDVCDCDGKEDDCNKPWQCDMN